MTKKSGTAAALTAALLISGCFTSCSRISENLPDSGSPSGEPAAETLRDDSRYIYSLLSDEEKVWYDCLKEAVDSFSPTVTFPETLEPETMRKLFISVYNQEEDQFWLNSLFYRPNNPTDTLALDYRYTPEQTVVMQDEIDKITDKIFSQFNSSTSDYEKLKAFHDYIVTNCTFSRDTEYANTIYGVLVDGYAQCEGYAFAFDYLCRLADIDCFVIVGSDTEGSLHAWNMVKLEDIWYHVDCTWDDPILSAENPDFLRHFYFLVNDSDIIGLTHIEDTTYFNYPVCTSSNNYYKREGLSAADGEEGIALLKTAAADALLNGRRDAAVRFTNRKAYNEAVDKLFTLNGIKSVFAAANDSSASKKVKTGKYVRHLDDDLFIIHITMVYED